MICNTCKMDTCKEAMGTHKSLVAVTLRENIDHECRIDGCEETLGARVMALSSARPPGRIGGARK